MHGTLPTDSTPFRMGDRVDPLTTKIRSPIVHPFDSSPQADEVQLQVIRRMQPEQRSLLAARFSDAIRDTTLAGIRARHPDVNDWQMPQEFARVTLDPHSFEQAYGKPGSGS